MFVRVAVLQCVSHLATQADNGTCQLHNGRCNCGNYYTSKTVRRTDCLPFDGHTLLRVGPPLCPCLIPS
jgi:hypothetical protein